jgi:hypothetical protein
MGGVLSASCRRLAALLVFFATILFGIGLSSIFSAASGHEAFHHSIN